MYTITDIQSLIAHSIENDNHTIQAYGIEEPVRYYLQIGGKRLRPALTLLAADLFGADIKILIPAALAIEYYHNFTLIHDDMMDEAPLRRGHATVHEKWNANTAILAGDALLVLAYRSLTRCNPVYLPQLMSVFNKSALEVCEGQQFDLEYEKRKIVSEEEYLRMIRLKTAVLLGTALQMGAIGSNASTEDAERVYEFGVNTGIAFQLQDDLLDVYGDAEKFGKRLGGDILSDKKTLLLIKALELANDEQKTQLNKWLHKPTSNPAAKITAVTAIYNELGIRELASETIQQYTNRAQELLEEISVPDVRKEIIRSFTKELLNRQS